jgi:eukaryotic-like serine/threonine-protein kinase
MSEARVGWILAERYRLDALLGRGGMGSVWRAHHVGLDSPVAIKLMEPEIAANQAGLERFVREAQAAAALRSPHVVQTLDFGVHEGTPYIAMELMVGESLATRLERLGRLSVVETTKVITHVGRAVAKAHEMGIVHRDLKPDNIFIVQNDEEEVVKVLDFGIAKMASPTAPASMQTRTGVMIGTPYYASPEQLEGSKLLDHRTDIWAMGVIGFECLLGVRPFEGESIAELVLRICTRPLPVPSSIGPVPPGFDVWFARACARELNQRFGSVRELSEALRGLPAGLSDTTQSSPSTEWRSAASSLLRTTSPVVETSQYELPRPKRTAWFVSGAATLALATMGAAFWLTRPSTSDEAAPSVSDTAASAPHSAAAPVSPPSTAALGSSTASREPAEPSTARPSSGAAGGPATAAPARPPNMSKALVPRPRPASSPAKGAENVASTPAGETPAEPARRKPVPAVPRDPLETR